MNKLKFWWNDYKKITKLYVNYGFFSTSNELLFTSTLSSAFTKPIIINHVGFGYYKYESYFKDLHRKELNKKSAQLFKKYQKDVLLNLPNGVVKSGKHIVKCEWDIDLVTAKATYSEVKNAKEIL